MRRCKTRQKVRFSVCCGKLATQRWDINIWSRQMSTSVTCHGATDWWQ